MLELDLFVFFDFLNLVYVELLDVYFLFDGLGVVGGIFFVGCCIMFLVWVLWS